MIYPCVWEHNGKDSLLYATSLPGAFSRGPNLETAIEKMPNELRSYLAWVGLPITDEIEIAIMEDKPSELYICDADSDVLFASEKDPLTMKDYLRLKSLALKSAADFFALYQAVPSIDASPLPPRKTFYGAVPRTAREMYEHTKSVNNYYFAEIEVEAANEGSIIECRQRGFSLLEQQENFLANPIFEGSYGEEWTLRKVLRRFIWHDRIHAKAMYRMAALQFGTGIVPNPFHFSV